MILTEGGCCQGLGTHFSGKGRAAGCSTGFTMKCLGKDQRLRWFGEDQVEETEERGGKKGWWQVISWPVGVLVSHALLLGSAACQLLTRVLPSFATLTNLCLHVRVCRCVSVCVCLYNTAADMVLKSQVVCPDVSSWGDWDQEVVAGQTQGLRELPEGHTSPTNVCILSLIGSHPLPCRGEWNDILDVVCIRVRTPGVWMCVLAVCDVNTHSMCFCLLETHLQAHCWWDTGTAALLLPGFWIWQDILSCKINTNF